MPACAAPSRAEQLKTRTQSFLSPVKEVSKGAELEALTTRFFPKQNFVLSFFEIHTVTCLVFARGTSLSDVDCLSSEHLQVRDRFSRLSTLGNRLHTYNFGQY